MKWYHWIGIAVVFAVVLLLWLLTGGKGPNPLRIAQREIDVVNAKAETKRVQADADHATALAHVEKKYEVEIAALDDAKLKRKSELEQDPAKLAAFIVRGKG